MSSLLVVKHKDEIDVTVSIIGLEWLTAIRV
jgi:hypothetical protein